MARAFQQTLNGIQLRGLSRGFGLRGVRGFGDAEEYVPGSGTAPYLPTEVDAAPSPLTPQYVPGSGTAPYRPTDGDATYTWGLDPGADIAKTYIDPALGVDGDYVRRRQQFDYATAKYALPEKRDTGPGFLDKLFSFFGGAGKGAGAGAKMLETVSAISTQQQAAESQRRVIGMVGLAIGVAGFVGVVYVLAKK